MALSNWDRIGKAVQLLAEGLAPFVDRECRAKFGDDWLDAVQRAPRKVNPGDAQFLLKVMRDQWGTIFSKKLSRSDRNYVYEFQDVRNAWAHNEPFSTDDALRALDTAKRLLESVAADAQANEVGKLHQDLLGQKSEQLPGTPRKAAPVELEGHPGTGLPARREVVIPHDDVTTGPVRVDRISPPTHTRVWRSEATGEYGDPRVLHRSFLVQVSSKGYDTILNNRYYENLKWKQKYKKGNEHHGMVEPGDQLVLYCTSTVPNETHKRRLAFSVIVSSVSDDRTTFKLGKPQFFENPLKLIDIHKACRAGKLDKCFDYCGKQWFNITMLEPTAVKQLFGLVEHEIPPV